MAPRKPDPRFKGERVQIKGRVPRELHAAALAAAERHRMTLNDYLGQLLAEDTGVPYTRQDGLDLDGKEALKTA